MTVVTSQSDFEKLMVLRLKEAELLLRHRDWDGAYYLAGYAVEFALKIRVIAQLMKSNSFPDKKLIKQHLFCKSRISEVGHLAFMFR
ncbi:MAG: hypothetical protein RLZZ326_1292 [Planctomycetota bacterium]|jgi:hypothetical protein